MKAIVRGHLLICILVVVGSFLGGSWEALAHYTSILYYIVWTLCTLLYVLLCRPQGTLLLSDTYVDYLRRPQSCRGPAWYTFCTYYVLRRTSFILHTTAQHYVAEEEERLQCFPPRLGAHL